MNKLTEEEILQAGKSLFAAEQNRSQVGLLSLQHPHMNLDDAYSIQNSFVTHKLGAGDRQIGWKIGLTSRAMQKALNIDIPDSGVLFETMSFPAGSRIPKDRFIQPRLEAEIAFVMKQDVDEIDENSIIAATDYVCPALEILDTRVLRHDPTTGKSRTVLDTISDNAANAGFVLGDSRHDLKQIDLRWVGVILKRNGSTEETGLGASVLDNPLTSMRWLAERLWHYGQKIRAGDVVLSGSFITVVEAPSGSEFEADFGAFGKIHLSFE